jgi:predicted dithiol-disulfide oxidoreductase (DUF899 family)
VWVAALRLPGQTCIQEHGIDLLAPMWQFLDLTPQGRGNWYASLNYGSRVQAVGT